MSEKLNDASKCPLCSNKLDTYLVCENGECDYCYIQPDLVAVPRELLEWLVDKAQIMDCEAYHSFVPRHGDEAAFRALPEAVEYMRRLKQAESLLNGGGDE